MDSSFKNVDNFGTIDPQKEEDLENEGNLKNDGTLNNEDSLTNERKYRKADYVQRRLCFVNVQSSLHENVVFLFLPASMPRMLYLSCGIPFPV